ncbi:MAG: 23S ribosomal RNA methyltransferase Erm [Anaerolineales bacterium]|jgi:23S rRNA (adenine-N6)-dimethyltransferase
MAKIQRKQIALGQNFLKSATLVRRLLGESSIGVSDAVLEIGAGRGVITAELARLARKVVALEKDPELVGLLRERFFGVPNVEILEGDFLQYRIFDGEYKIFANIPFNRTADIVRKIVCASTAPNDAYLILQKEAAEKFSGIPAETQFSILAKPRFQIQIIRELRRTDFEPMPGVDSVLLRIQKRSPALVLPEDAALFQKLVCYGFAGWKRNLGKTLQHIFSYRQWKRLSKELRFPLDATPSELTLEQWLGLLDCLKRRVPLYKQLRLQIERSASAFE